jgi:hypothetical protein
VEEVITEVEQPHELLPTDFRLEQNFPNPFNPTTRIRFALPQKSKVRLTLYDTLGREVITLVNDERQAGIYAIDWNGLDSAGQRAGSGVYFFRIEAGEFVQTRKLTLIK